MPPRTDVRTLSVPRTSAEQAIQTTMSPKTNNLDKLRKQIDDIDNKMLDLLMQRTDVVEQIGEAKRLDGNSADLSGSLNMRPAREARLMRRLLDKHDGRLPEVVVARIWREMISAFTQLQGPLKVAVCAPEKSVGYWDLSRMQFGSATPMTLHRSHGVVLRAISEGDGTVGVLPLPQDGEDDPWWTHLAVQQENVPRVIARLPFVQDRSAWFEGMGALALAPIDHEDSDNDISLIVIAADPQISRARLHRQMTAADFNGRIISAVGKGGDHAEWLHLVEVDGYLAPKDKRITKFIKDCDGDVERVVRIGGYAVPVQVGEDDVSH
jgi:chorismate mutase / prephenate dehydratase